MPVKFKITVLVLYCLALSLNLFAGKEEKDIFTAIRKGDTLALRSLITNADINKYYGRKKDKTLLHQAIFADQFPVLKFLIGNGADLELQSDGLTPLMDAAEMNRLEIAHYLLDMGAKVDVTDAKNNTALFFAAHYASLRMTKLLIQRGADVKHQNNHHLMALDYAISANNDPIVEYLTTMIKRKDTYRKSPGYTDGPHVLLEDDGTIRVYYFERDSAENKTVMVDHYFGRKEDQVVSFWGFTYDTLNSYTIYKQLLPQPSELTNIRKIIAIGDRHGYYDSLVVFLKNSGIIDNQLNWSWGDGHLVFTGDLFDRGSKVTESLWLIYKLERQARDAGGDVHVLLGNHELMNMTNDVRYNSDKYQFFSTYFDISYPQLYLSNTVLGKWLRSRNTVVKINDVMFIHGGISPQLYNLKIPVDSINYHIRNFLQGNISKENSKLVNFLLFTYGPFWYRGYFTDGTLPTEITPELLDQILKFYNVSYMVLGHTDVHNLIPIFNNKVLPIDIPFEFKEFKQQGLLIDNGQFFKVYSNGSRVLLF